MKNAQKSSLNVFNTRIPMVCVLRVYSHVKAEKVFSKFLQIRRRRIYYNQFGLGKPFNALLSYDICPFG
jgi:hypothetical protein